MPTGERTALVASAPPEPAEAARARRSRFGPIARVHFTSLLMSMTFAFTQTALVYTFKLMTCEDYYATHPPPSTPAGGDRCNIPAIEASTASSVAQMSTMTVIGTIVNLFTTAGVINLWGVKAAMFQQTFWAALRNLCQIYAQLRGGRAGINITIVTQVFNVFGSGGGFQLCANSYISILAAEEERTAQFGILSGIFMLGSGIGFSVGGVLFKYVAQLAPFVLAFAFLVFCTLFGAFFLPYIPPGEGEDKDARGGEKKRQGILAPLAVFLPRKREEGRRTWAMFFLGLGTFLSVLATGYIAMALQLVATNVFDFKPDTSGYMLSLTLVVRAFFLSVCFPKIISAGRKWYAEHPERFSASTSKLASPASPGSPSLSPSEAEEALLPAPADSVQSYDGRRPREAGSGITSRSPSAQSKDSRLSRASRGSGTTGDSTLVEEERDADGELELVLEPTAVPGAKFDLLFLKYSILLDGVLTSAVSLAYAPWHMYAAAVVLPFASGTSPAVKGVILEFAAAALSPSYPQSCEGEDEDEDEDRPPPYSANGGEAGGSQVATYGATNDDDRQPRKKKRTRVTHGGISNSDKSNVLSGIALIEKFAQVVTISLFSYFFAVLSEANKPRLIFVLDGLIAFLAFAVLLPVQMPKARRV